MRKIYALLCSAMLMAGASCNKASNEYAAPGNETCVSDTPTIIIFPGGQPIGNVKMGKNVGTVAVGATMAHASAIQNNGEATMIIDSIATNNPDTRANASMDTIERGVIIGVSTFVTPDEPGDFQREVNIYFKNAKKPFTISFGGTAELQANR